MYVWTLQSSVCCWRTLLYVRICMENSICSPWTLDTECTNSSMRHLVSGWTKSAVDMFSPPFIPKVWTPATMLFLGNSNYGRPMALSNFEKHLLGKGETSEQSKVMALNSVSHHPPKLYTNVIMISTQSLNIYAINKWRKVFIPP